MKISKRITTILFLMLCFQSVFSQEYISDKLKTIAKKANVTINSSLPTGYSDAGMYSGKALCVGIDNSRRVFHVGYKLFATEMKIKYPSEVYDFLERYLLELDCVNSEVILRQYLDDDGVVIVDGNLSNVKKITTSTSFSFTRAENLYYEIQWKDSGKTLLKLRFPINFELLLGTRKKELENIFQSIISVESRNISHSSSTPRLEMMEDGCFRSSPVETYQLEELSTAEYYERGDGNTFIPIYDDSQPIYSLCNMFHGLTDNDCTLNIKQNLYGYKNKNFSVALSQWINYCTSKKLRIYTCAIEDDEKPENLKVMVIAQSVDLAYNHLLTVEVPKDFMTTGKKAFKASLNAFIPTHNIKNIYQETVNKK